MGQAGPAAHTRLLVLVLALVLVSGLDLGLGRTCLMCGWSLVVVRVGGRGACPGRLCHRYQRCPAPQHRRPALRMAIAAMVAVMLAAVVVATLP